MRVFPARDHRSKALRVSDSLERDIAVESWYSVNGTFGLLRLIPQGEAPRPVLRGIAEALLSPIGDDCAMTWTPSFKIGQTIRITDGLFANLVGTLEQLDASGRVRVLLDLLGRAVSVALSQEVLARQCKSRREKIRGRNPFHPNGGSMPHQRLRTHNTRAYSHVIKEIACRAYATGDRSGRIQPPRRNCGVLLTGKCPVAAKYDSTGPWRWTWPFLRRKFSVPTRLADPSRKGEGTHRRRRRSSYRTAPRVRSALRSSGICALTPGR